MKVNKQKRFKMMKKVKRLLIFLSIFVLFYGCAENQNIVNNVSEREANEIIVLLASKNISAQKIAATATGVAAGAGPSNLWNISVHPDDAVSAMALLNNLGLPRHKGTTLLELFAKEGLMTSDKEETIRYQAGLEEELKNTIRKIDGVLDADVQISFPSTETAGILAEKPKFKAAVYVKHQGVLDDPNNHLDSKIKRLVSGSVDGLDFESVSVISDRAKTAQLPMMKKTQILGPDGKQQQYVSIWSIIMTKTSAARFRFLFFIMSFIILLFGTALGFLIYKFYPELHKTKRKKKALHEKTEEK